MCFFVAQDEGYGGSENSLYIHCKFNSPENPENSNGNYREDCRTSTTCNTNLTDNGVIYDTDNSLSHNSEDGFLHYSHDNLTVNDVT